MKRLGHVVVGAEAETLDLVLDPGEAGEDQDGRFHLAEAQSAQYLESRHIRQVKIEQDYVVVIDLAEIDALLAELRRIDVEALGFEHELDGKRGGAIVLDKQYA